MTRSSTGRIARFVCSLSVATACVWAPAANAQEPAPSVETAPSVTTTPADPSAPAVPAPPPPPVATPVRARPVAAPEPLPERAESDLDVEKRRFAIGYGGLSQVPVGGPGALDLTVPSIALRYWINPTMGVDVGVGIGWQGGSVDVGGMSLDKDSVTGFILQGGLPIALSTRRHVSFQIIPSVAFAHGQSSQQAYPLGAGPADFSGTRVAVGARAGFELFFGFIGIPELALNATVGMQFESRVYKVTAMGNTQSDTTLSFTTTVQNNPWDIFAGNVAARYYF